MIKINNHNIIVDIQGFHCCQTYILVEKYHLSNKICLVRNYFLSKFTNINFKLLNFVELLRNIRLAI